MPPISLRLKSHTYPIVIGCGLNHRLVQQLKTRAACNRVFVFCDAAVYVLYGKQIEKLFSKQRIEYISFVLPSGETSKSQSTLHKIYDFLLAEKISRTDFILAVGGGIVTDLVGYAAATILRGVRWGAVPTTLLGIVDAAIGGKTGINHPRGKNLLGAFWQPEFVICDLNYMPTLPKREVVAGLGEVLKYAGLIGSKITPRLQQYLNSDNLLELKRLQPLVQMCANYKAKIVMADERESHQRMFLNLGHTFAHAIESSLGYGRLRHGEAVIIGLLAAVILSKKVNRRASGSLNDYEILVKQFLRFVRYYPLRIRSVLNNMKIDKKRSGRSQKFVLLKRPGKPFIVSGIDEQMVSASLEQCFNEYKKSGTTNG